MGTLRFGWPNLVKAGFDKVEGAFHHPQPNQPTAATAAPAPVASAPTDPRHTLVKAQNHARQQYAPSGDGKMTYCNQATVSIARAVGAPLTPFVDARGVPYLSNRMAQNLAVSPDYREVAPDEVQDLANQGRFVVGVHHNPSGHGHAVTARPEGVSGDQPVGHTGPLLNDVGKFDRIARQSGAFEPNDQVYYYTPAKGGGH